MKKTNFDLGWRFSLDGSPKQLSTCPMTSPLHRPRRPDSRMLDKGGFFQGGNGIYKKTLACPEELEGGKVLLEVEGAYMNAEVYHQRQPGGVQPLWLHDLPRRPDALAQIGG